MYGKYLCKADAKVEIQAICYHGDNRVRGMDTGQDISKELHDS